MGSRHLRLDLRREALPIVDQQRSLSCIRVRDPRLWEIFPVQHDGYFPQRTVSSGNPGWRTKLSGLLLLSKYNPNIDISSSCYIAISRSTGNLPKPKEIADPLQQMKHRLYQCMKIYNKVAKIDMPTRGEKLVYFTENSTITKTRVNNCKNKEEDIYRDVWSSGKRGYCVNGTRQGRGDSRRCGYFSHGEYGECFRCIYSSGWG